MTINYSKLMQFLFVISIFFLVACGTSTSNRKDITLEPYKIENGKWAYRLTVGDFKIDQTMVPAIEGMHFFETEEDALKTGKLMIEKLEEDRNQFPSLSVEEVKALNLKGL